MEKNVSSPSAELIMQDVRFLNDVERAHSELSAYLARISPNDPQLKSTESKKKRRPKLTPDSCRLIIRILQELMKNPNNLIAAVCYSGSAANLRKAHAERVKARTGLAIVNIFSQLAEVNDFEDYSKVTIGQVQEVLKKSGLKVLGRSQIYEILSRFELLEGLAEVRDRRRRNEGC